MKKVKRNSIDIILTDMRPVELPMIFTLKIFYDFLTNNKIQFRIENNKNKFIDNQWHATPLKFYVLKNDFSFRELSLPNPLSMVESVYFVENYQNDVINCMDRSCFSIRKHQKSRDLNFINKNKQLITYKNLNEKQLNYLNLEATGNYFNIYPFPRLSSFYNSEYWFSLIGKYHYFKKVDINKCFDSIYTHTFNWIIAEKPIDSKKYNNNNIYSVLDRILQNFNGSITNGIIVGPEFSRMAAEILLQKIDEEVYFDLNNQNYNLKDDYDIVRFIDDIYIFSKSKEITEKIFETYRDKLNFYQLKFNDMKIINGELPYIWFKWKEEINQYLNYFNKICFYNFNDNSEYLVKSKNIANLKLKSSLKLKFQNIIASETNKDSTHKMVSYMLSSIYNKLNSSNLIFNQKNNEFAVRNFLDLIFFIYSFSLSYGNSQKIVSIITLINNEIPSHVLGTELSTIIQKYNYIFDTYIDDVNNLLLLISYFEISLDLHTEIKLKEKILKSGNPLNYAVFLLYTKYSDNLKREFVDKIEIKINEELDKICHIGDFFLYSSVWWIYIFINCPHISSNTNEKIILKVKDCERNLINELGSNKNNNKISINAKLIIIKFLLDSEKNKFINWDLNKIEFIESVTFSTFDKTIFNNENFNFDY